MVKKTWFRSLHLLKEDIRTALSGYKGLKGELRLVEEYFENGLISNDTYESIRRGDTNNFLLSILEKDLEYYNSVAKVFLKYTTRITSKDEADICFGGVEMKTTMNFTTVELSWEGSVSLKKPYTIFFNQGTAIFLEYFSLLYSVVAGTVPKLSLLKSYLEDLNKSFIHNYENIHSDNRPILERLANPFNANLVSHSNREWTARLNPFQGKLAKELIRLMKIYIIGHEFGHILVNEDKNSPFIRDIKSVASTFCRSNNIPIIEAWLIEFTCDIISLNLSLHFLDENPIKSVIEIKKSDGFINELAILTSRNQILDVLLEMDFNAKSEEKHQLARIDEKSMLLNSIRIFFWSFEEISKDSSSKSHPKASDRLKLLEWYSLNIIRFPELVFHSGNALDMLRINLRENTNVYELNHPLFN